MILHSGREASLRSKLASSVVLGFALAATACSEGPDPAVTRGAQLYAENCASCHGASLEGGARGPELRGPSSANSASALAAIIANGVQNNGMPGFGQTLSPDEIQDIVSFLKDYENRADLNEESDPATGAGREIDPVPGVAEALDYSIQAEVFIDGLSTPWALAFIDDETALVSERPGRLRVIRNGVLDPDPVSGIPSVLNSSHEWNQGGLLDVATALDAENRRWVYLAYSHERESPKGSQSELGMTKVVRGRLEDNRWTNQETVFEAPASSYSEKSWHYGGRLAITSTGELFLSVGDRGEMEQARQLSRPNGKIHRLNVNGSTPADNPFVGRTGAIGSIFSLGNRNPQGLAINPADGSLWETEHGPRGGDELNVIRAGADYGWPTITYGIDYDGTPISDLTKAPGLRQPIHYWRPSIAVSGITFYDGEEFPLWKGKLLVTGLSSRDLRLLTLDGDRVLHEEIIVRFEGRPYEPVIGPRGEIYVVLDAPGQIIRLTAQEERRQ